jgi:hypothetical protein
MSEVADTGLSGVVTPGPDSNLRGGLPRGSRARTLDAGFAGMTKTTHYRCLLKGYVFSAKTLTDLVAVIIFK